MVRRLRNSSRKYFLLFALLCVPCLAGGDDDIQVWVNHCVTDEGALVRSLLRLQVSPTDETAFTDLFLGTNENLSRAIESRYRLGGDDGMDVAQALLNKIWTGEIRWEGDRTWTDDQVFTWLLSHAGPELSRLRGEGQGKGQVRSINVTADKEAGDDYDFMGATEGSSHSEQTLTLEMIELLPDALHRLVLIRLMEGRTYDEIGKELSKSPRHVGTMAREARTSLSEVLKGRDPIVRTTHRDPWTANLVQSILEKELSARPILMPEDALTLTEAKFWEILDEQNPTYREYLEEYFIRGKRPIVIARERNLEKRAVGHVLEKASRIIGDHFAAEYQALSIDQIWIVNESGLPVSQFRQLDYAPPPLRPAEVSGSDYWKATKDLDLKAQEVLQMRFLEGLSTRYIARARGVEPEHVTNLLVRGVRHLSQSLGRSILVDDLVVTGDVSMVHTSEVKIPAKLFFRELALKEDPNERTKLELVLRISGIPVTNLSRVTFVDEHRQPIFESARAWNPLPEAETETISPADFKVVQSRLSAEDARWLDLYIRHRWSMRSLAYHFEKPVEEIERGLVRGRIALTKYEGQYVSLSHLVVGHGRERPQTIQVSASQFKEKFALIDHPTIENVNVMLVAWKNRKVDSLKNLELVDENGAPHFNKNHNFIAFPPKEPVTMTVADFEKGLALSLLSDLEIKAMRMRFRYGWGSSAVAYLLDLPSKDVGNLFTRGLWSLSQNSGGRVLNVESLLLIEEGTPDVVLLRTGVDLAKLAERVRLNGKYSRQAVRGAAASLSGVSTLKLDDIIPMNPEGRAFGRKEVFYIDIPENPKVLPLQKITEILEVPEQVFAMRLRCQYHWGNTFIEGVMGISEQDLQKIYSAAANKLRRFDPELRRSNLLIVDDGATE